jgi:hypothetical protein
MPVGLAGIALPTQTEGLVFKGQHCQKNSSPLESSMQHNQADNTNIGNIQSTWTEVLGGLVSLGLNFDIVYFQKAGECSLEKLVGMCWLRR